MERRAPDGARYIGPQARHADLVFTLLPVDPEMLAADGQIGEDRVKLRVRLREGLYFEQLSRVLIGVCGLSVLYGEHLYLGSQMLSSLTL